MDKIRVSAKTKDEAITKALIQLSTTSDRLSYDVLVQGSNGIFGIGAKPWIIEAYAKEPVEEIALMEEIREPKEEKPQELPKAEEKPLEKTEAAPVRREERTRSENRERRFDRERAPREKKYPRGGYEPKDAVVKAEERAPERRHREIKPLGEEEADTLSGKAVEFLKSVLSGMKMEVTVSSEFHHESNELLINLEGPDMGILIGKRGQTLDSLQYLCSLIVNKDHKEDYIRVKLDTEDYRKRREQTLHNLARNIAYKVKRSHKPVSLEPMNPYERRIIHSALQNDRFVSTKSEGEEPFRHVVIFAKESRDRGGHYNSRPYNRDRGERSSYHGRYNRENQSSEKREGRYESPKEEVKS